MEASIHVNVGSRWLAPRFFMVLAPPPKKEKANSVSSSWVVIEDLSFSQMFRSWSCTISWLPFFRNLVAITSWIPSWFTFGIWFMIPDKFGRTVLYNLLTKYHHLEVIPESNYITLRRFQRQKRSHDQIQNWIHYIPHHRNIIYYHHFCHTHILSIVISEPHHKHLSNPQ